MESGSTIAPGKRKADAISPPRAGIEAFSGTSVATGIKRQHVEDASSNATPGDGHKSYADFLPDISRHARVNDESEEDDKDEDDEDESGGPSMESCLNDILKNIGLGEEAYQSLPETETEEQSFFMKGRGNVTLKTYLRENDQEFQKWLSTIHVQCTFKGKNIGYAAGRYVKRDYIRAHFWRDMEEPCQELADIAFELFDRYGRLKQEYIDHPVRKGTGIWGRELDLGDLFIVEHVHVDREWRRKGLGSRMLSTLLQKALGGGRRPIFNLVSPGFLTREVEKDGAGKTKREQREIRNSAHDTSVSFYRSHGFRRIGASKCFGLAIEQNHKSRQIVSKEDFNLPDIVEEGDDSVEKGSQDRWDHETEEIKRLKLMKERLPLHHAAITLEDSKCLAFFEKFERQAGTKAFWEMVDSYQKNVLHIAACQLKARSVRWLLENVDHPNGERLSATRDIKGYTPLEALNAELESKRTTLRHGMMIVSVSDSFRGFDAQAVICLAYLQGWALASPIRALRIKFGCTCGECLDGFLSPRMKLALLAQAEIIHDVLRPDKPYGDLVNGEDWCSSNKCFLTHVPEDMQRNFQSSRALRQGYANIFEHVAATLRANTAPTVLNVRYTWKDSSEWPPVTRQFYEKGGSTKSVLRLIFESARDEDELAGNGELQASSGEDLAMLPRCRNDHEFGFVAQACGVLRVSELERGGPELPDFMKECIRDSMWMFG